MDFLPSRRQGVHPPDATRRARREPAEVASLSETGNEQEHDVRLPAFWQPGDGLRPGAIAQTASGRNLATSSAQPAVSLLTEKNQPSGSTTTSRRSFDTSMPP